MSYEIDYTGMPEDQKQTQAVKDCIEWLGKEQFAKVVEILILDEGRSPRHMVRLGLMMQGIQGYPAEVMMNRFWAVKDDRAEKKPIKARIGDPKPI